MDPTTGARPTPLATDGGRDDAAASTVAAEPNTPGTTYCPIVTPFDETGAVDADSIRRLVDYLLQAGVDGLVPCGTTGEFAALTDAERRTVVETTVAAADGRVPVLAGVGGTAPGAVRERIQGAAAAGADAVVVVVPYYGGQASPEGNEAFFEAVLTESPVPAYLYDIPSAVGQTLAPETVRSLADHDAVAGIKDSGGDLTVLDELVASTPDDFAVFQGWDAQFVPGLAMGADGTISALAHCVPDAMQAAARAVAAGNLARARAIQFEVLDELFRACSEHGFAATIKAVLSDRGIVETTAVRHPNVALPADQREAVLWTVESARAAADRILGDGDH